jgi:ferredoxin-nitrite reductase
VPEALLRLLQRYRDERRVGERFHEWARRVPNAELRATIRGAA